MNGKHNSDLVYRYSVLLSSSLTGLLLLLPEMEGSGFLSKPAPWYHADPSLIQQSQAVEEIRFLTTFLTREINNMDYIFTGLQPSIIVETNLLSFELSDIFYGYIHELHFLPRYLLQWCLFYPVLDNPVVWVSSHFGLGTDLAHCIVTG